MNSQEAIHALESLGYDSDEAAFLRIAALQSGCFLRRQFLSFVGGTKGWKDVALINKLRMNRHCRTMVYRHSRMVYQLSAKPLYAALGDPDNRNRREHQPATIKNKLMGLDFVLEHPAYAYLMTEHDKLDYIKGLNIPDGDLPKRWFESPRGRKSTPKYFVEKYPLFIAAPDGTACSVVHFTYVDEGQQTTDRFKTFLENYGRLMTALPDYRVVYIAEHDGLFEKAGQRFEEFSLSGERQAGLLSPGARDLLAYFEARRAYETRDFSSFDTARLIRYREEKNRFGDEHYEELFRQWRRGGAPALLAILSPNGALKEVPCERFSTYVLNHDYDLFGTLTNRPSF